MDEGDKSRLLSRSRDTRVVASVDVGKTNMAVCVARIRACADGSRYIVRETRKEPPRVVLGDHYPSVSEIRSAFPAMDIEWEGLHYVTRIVRWGVYSLKSSDEQAEIEERTGLRARSPGKNEREPPDDTLETLVPLLMKRAKHWIDAWVDLGVTDICIEQQVAMGGGRAPGMAGCFAGSMAANVTAKVLSHVLQCMCLDREHRGCARWNIHFTSPRLTNMLVDHIRGEKRQGKGVKKADKKKMAVQAVQILIDRHNPPLAGIFARATRSKRDDLSDSFLQAVRFVRDADGTILKRQVRQRSGKRQRNACA